jgi:hypothetical protein
MDLEQAIKQLLVMRENLVAVASNSKKTIEFKYLSIAAIDAVVEELNKEDRHGKA